jgi:hypothetical protein
MRVIEQLRPGLHFHDRARPPQSTGSGTLTHIARILAIPPHILGIAGPDDADFTAMLACVAGKAYE